MGKAKLREITENINSMLALVTAVASIISIILIYLFKGGAYLLDKGYYDFWNIPSTYIEIDSANKLFQLLLVLSITIIIGGISLTYCHFLFGMCYTKLKLWKIAGMLLAVPMTCTFLWFCYLSVQAGMKAVVYYITYNLFEFLKISMLFTFMAGILIACIGTFYFPVFMDSLNISYERKKDIKQEPTVNSSEQKVSKNLPLIIRIIIVFIGTVSIFWAGFTIYQEGKNSANQEKTLDIIKTDNMLYIVLKKYSDKWILKEGIIIDERIYINRDTYLISDISEKQVLRYSIDPKYTISECMVENDEFEIKYQHHK